MKNRIKITAEDKRDKIKAFLLEKECNFWLNQNNDMFNDYTKLAQDVLFFKTKWGIPVTLVVEQIKEKTGRGLGKQK